MKKILIQLVFIFLAITLFIYTYTANNKDDLKKVEIEKEKIIENEELLPPKESLFSPKDVTINLEYSGTDNRGNFYKILSEYSETNIENSSLINLKGVSAVINLFDGRTITIRSDSALYDQSNNDTRFKGNVVINEKFNSIKAENADLYFSKKALK